MTTGPPTIPSVIERRGEEMPYILCRKCGQLGSVDHGRQTPTEILRGVLICGHCGELNPFEAQGGALTFVPGNLQWGALNAAVPQAVRDYFSEAEASFYAGAYRATAAMCRSAVEEALEQREITNWGLKAKIEAALKSGLLTERVHSLAYGSKIIADEAIHAATEIHPGEITVLIPAAILVVNHLWP